MKTEPAHISAVVMNWYLQEDFDEIKRLMADGHAMHSTYAQWLSDATLGEEHQRRAGRTVVRAIIRPQAFKQWCQSRGLNVDAQARAAFASDWLKTAQLKSKLN